MSKKIIPKKAAKTPLPRWLIPAALVGGLALIAALVAVFVNSNRGPAYEPEVTGAPRAEIDETTQDFGKVGFGVPVKSVFTVRNIGDEPLVIQQDPVVELVRGC